jgi:hypothetical protein
MASREDDISKIADRLREQMFGGMSTVERAAREAELDKAMQQRRNITDSMISTDEDVSPQVRGLRDILRNGTATLKAPEGTPPELAEAMQKQFAAGRKPAPASKGFIADMAEQLYNNPVTRAAFVGSEEERAAVLQQAHATQIANVAKQFEAMGVRQPNGQNTTQAATDAMAANITNNPQMRKAASHQPEVAAMLAVLQAQGQAGPEMAKKLPGLMSAILSGKAPTAVNPAETAAEEAYESRKDSVKPIRAWETGSSTPPMSQHAKAQCDNIRQNMAQFVEAHSGRELSQGERIAFAAQNILMGQCSGPKGCYQRFNFGFVLAFRHNADERFRTGFTHQHPALAAKRRRSCINRCFYFFVFQRGFTIFIAHIMQNLRQGHKTPARFAHRFFLFNHHGYCLQSCHQPVTRRGVIAEYHVAGLFTAYVKPALAHGFTHITITHFGTLQA